MSDMDCPISNYKLIIPVNAGIHSLDTAEVQAFSGMVLIHNRINFCMVTNWLDDLQSWLIYRLLSYNRKPILSA
jgi:hypothetical protein